MTASPPGAPASARAWRVDGLISDLDEFRPGAVIEADVCIVGAGAAGISTALNLQHCGLNVCLLESGGAAEAVDVTDLYDGQSVGYRMDTTIGRYRGLGGSTSRWTGRCAPLGPIDFAERPWIDWSGWPLARGELDEFYRRAWAFCAIRDVVRGDEEVLAELGQDRIAIAASQLDRFIWRFPSRLDLHRLNLGEAFAEELRLSRDIQVVLHANACGFETSPHGGRIAAVTVRSLGGADARVTARAFVLGCGGLENARLLLNSAATVPGGPGNEHDLVGRFFMQHLRGDTATVQAAPASAAALQDVFNFFPARASTQYEVGLVLPEHVQRDEELLNVSAVLTYQAREDSSWRSGITVIRDLRQRKVDRRTLGAAARLARHPWEAASAFWRRGVRGRPGRFSPDLIQVNVDLEQAPDPDSRVTLTDDVDALGQRRLRVDWRVSDLERRTAARITGTVAAEIGRLGLGTVALDPWLLDPERHPSPMVATHHHIGTTRMAADPRKGVVDADCKVYGTANLFVAGSSVFPTGGHANPTLTIVALSIRLAGHLRQALSRARVGHLASAR